MTGTTIELHPAYMWDCDECGRENFARAVYPELSEDEVRELAYDMGVIESADDDLPPGMILMAPNKVQCIFCNAKFDVYHEHNV